jgi:hypothetical protein
MSKSPEWQDNLKSADDKKQQFIGLFMQTHICIHPIIHASHPRYHFGQSSCLPLEMVDKLGKAELDHYVHAFSAYAYATTWRHTL